jgi:hypothetical protein
MARQSLVPNPLELPARRGDETGVPVGDDQPQHPGQPTLLLAAQDARQEPGETRSPIRAAGADP